VESIDFDVAVATREAEELAERALSGVDQEAQMQLAQEAMADPVLQRMWALLLPRYGAAGQVQTDRNYLQTEIWDFVLRAYQLRLSPLGERPEVIPLRQWAEDGSPDSFSCYVSLDRLKMDVLRYQSERGFNVRISDETQVAVVDEKLILEGLRVDGKAGDVAVTGWVEINQPQVEWLQLFQEMKGMSGADVNSLIGPMPREWLRFSSVKACRVSEPGFDPRMRSALRVATDRAVRGAIAQACPGLDEWRVRTRTDYRQMLENLLGLGQHDLSGLLSKSGGMRRKPDHELV
jgi:hypothetical protein